MKRSLCVMAVALGVGLGAVMAHAQLPEIYEVLPRTARAGEILTVFGQDFDPVAENNIVYVSGVRASVRESWVGELEIEVPEAAQEGIITVVTGGKIAISPQRFQPLFARLSANSPVYVRSAFLTAFDYVGFASADLNGDGGPELLCVNREARVDVFEYVFNGVLISSNSLPLRARFAAGSVLNTNLLTGDFDADGRIDVLLAGRAGFDLFRNVHEGGSLSNDSFAPGVRVVEGRQQDLEFELADVNRDGRLDVITREPLAVSYNLNTYDPNSTNRSLGPRTLVIPNMNLVVRHMTTGDLNRDGHVDVVVATTDNVRIFSHNSPSETSNAFTQVIIPIAGVSFVQLTDVQGDGLPDILTHSGSTGAYIVLRNRTEGGHLETNDFEEVRLTQREISTVMPNVLDVNGDGFQDILRGTFGAGVYYENQSRFLADTIFQGSYLAATNTLTNSAAVITADLNRDGAQDVIILQGRVAIYQNMNLVRAQAMGVSVFREPVLGETPLFAVRVFGMPGEMVTLQRSTTLNTWENASTARIPTSGFHFFEGEATNRLQFFRAQPMLK